MNFAETRRSQDDLSRSLTSVSSKCFARNSQRHLTQHANGIGIVNEYAADLGKGKRGRLSTTYDLRTTDPTSVAF
jgi:hypothetical protein